MPVHHVPDEMLLAYAAGATSAGEELLVACHLTLCPTCRARVDAGERVGEGLLARAQPVAPPDHLLAAVMGRLDQPERTAPPPPAECPVFPLPLRRRIGPLASLRWRGVGFDLRAAKIELEGTQRVFLLDFPPGFRIPTHGHEGAERTLVLRGGFDDERATFERGDVSWREDPGHDVRVHPGGRCTTLFVNDGAAEVGWLTPLLDWWLHR